MPLLFQHRIYRSDLQNNPGVFYVFGDNTIRRGLGGQAGEMRGEPNAIGIATKWSPGSHAADFFSDDQYDEITKIIHDDYMKVWRLVNAGRTVVLPSDGLGTGLSELPTRAPRINNYLLALIERLKERAKHTR